MLEVKLKGMGAVTLKPKCQNNTFLKNKKIMQKNWLLSSRGQRNNYIHEC
jgi:hypothetical protein